MAKSTIRVIFLITALLISLSGVSFSEDFSLPTLLDIIESTEEVDSTPVAPPVSTILITSIEVSGQKNVPVKEILDAVFSKVGEPLIEQKVNADVKAIFALGYFSDVSSEFKYYGGGRKVVYVVEENPVVTSISFEGNVAFSSEALLSTMETKTGKALNFTVLRNDIRRIDDMYHSEGYILSRVIDVSTDQETGVLSIKIIEGVVDDIKIEGNENTQDYVIRRELKTKPGDVLNEEVLSKDLRRIFNLGFFSEISPTFIPGDSPDKVTLVVRVKEKRTSTINFGGGYGERQGWFGFADLSLNNLFGTGQAVMIRGQSGQELQTYQFKYYNPWILEDQLGDHTSFTFKRWYTIGSDVYFSGYSEIHNGWETIFGKPFYDVWRASWSLGGEWVGPYGDSSFEAYNTLTTGLAISYDTRDFIMNPTSGVLHTVSTKWGWKYASKITNFVKYGIDTNFYFPLAERQVLAFHTGVGLGRGDVPIGDYYWAGGANSIRGFYPSEARIGVKKLIFNLEYRYTFNEIFQAVLFGDFGNAWNNGWPQYDEFLGGAGFGVRLNTPLGPIRLDYGVGSSKSFSEGIIHFSIGQAF